MDKMALCNLGMPLSSISALAGEDVVIHFGSFPGVTVVGGVGVHGVHPMDSHGKAEHGFIGVGRTEIGPNVFIVVQSDVLALVVESIAGGTFADEVQSAADIRFPMDSAVVLPDFSVLKQPLFGIDRVIGAAAGEIVRAGEVIPEVVQIGISQTVRVDKNGLIKGRAL